MGSSASASSGATTGSCPAGKYITALGFALRSVDTDEGLLLHGLTVKPDVTTATITAARPAGSPTGATPVVELYAVCTS